MKRFSLRFSGLIMLIVAWQGNALAWDYAGHRLVNQLALASLPTDFPGFVLTPAAKERIAFLAGEPDRWRNTPDLTLRHFNGPDHYLDIDELPLCGLEPANLPSFRYDFAAQLAAARAAKPENFPPIDPAKDLDHTKRLVGFLPWTITEHYAKLKSAFSYLKTLEADGTAQEVANAQQNVIYLMGVMGHFVGDGSQPLHTTRHYNGWIGRNPHRYTTNRTFHSWIDGGYIDHAGITAESLFARLRPARSVATGEMKSARTNVFPVVMTYLVEQFKLVEPLYQLDKEGKLSGKGAVSPEGYNFITGQMIKAAQMLGDFWLTAWLEATPDNFLRAQLAKRKSAREKTAAP